MKGSKKSNFTDVMLTVDFKFTVSIFLMMLAFVEYTKTPDLTHSLCLWGMGFSCLGDLCLMDYAMVPRRVFKGKQFYVGAGFFTIAHIIYRQMFRSLTPDKTIWGIGEWISTAILLVFCVLLLFVRFNRKSPFFMGLAGFYTSTIFMTLAAAITSVAALEGRHIWAMIGVISFIVSDFFLLIREVKKDTPTVRKLIWVFYPIAQILIIMGI